MNKQKKLRIVTLVSSKTKILLIRLIQTFQTLKNNKCAVAYCQYLVSFTFFFKRSAGTRPRKEHQSARKEYQTFNGTKSVHIQFWPGTRHGSL